MPFLHEIKAKIWICPQFRKNIGLFFILPIVGNLLHGIGFGAGGDVDVGLHGLERDFGAVLGDFVAEDGEEFFAGEEDEGLSVAVCTDLRALLNPKNTQ